MFTERDKNAARTIVSIFETSKKSGDPAAVAVLDDGAGISYGIHQCTHRAGSLALVLEAFAALSSVHQASARRWAGMLADRSGENIRAMGRNAQFKQYLRDAGRTPEMRQAQEDVFAVHYMSPALAECERCQFVAPLSLAVVYDAFIQGGWKQVKAATNSQFKSPVAEKVWIGAYLAQRVQYLSGLASQAARNSVYRPKAFQALVSDGDWQLATPFTVRGITVNAGDL